MRIGVSGASGHLGRKILAELGRRSEGHELIGISRSADTVPSIASARLGDYDSPDALTAAYAGLDRLVIIPTADPTPGVRPRQHVAAVEAAVAAGVEHIVFISSAGTRAAREPNVWASYYPAEQRVMQSAPNWTVLRMNYYIDTFIEEARMSVSTGAIMGLAENRAAFVARDDVAAAAAGILLGSGHEGAIYTATGPRRYSGAERCAAISAAAGKPVEFLTLSEGAMRDSLTQAGLPGPLVELIVNIQRALADGGFDIATGDVERLAGRPPRSLEAALAQALR